MKSYFIAHIFILSFAVSALAQVGMNLNTSPYPPHADVRAAGHAAIELLNTYSDMNNTKLRQVWAEVFGVTPQEIYFGHGATDVFQRLSTMLAEPGSNYVTPLLSFAGYRSMPVRNHDSVQIIETALGVDFQVDVEAIKRAVNSKTRFVILANPANPTGTFLTTAQIQDLASYIVKKHPHAYLILDAAYFYTKNDNVDIADPIQMQRRFPNNVIVVGTFSKSMSLAGARLGYLIANPKIITQYSELKNSAYFPINLSAEMAGIAAASVFHSYIKETKPLIIEGREFLRQQMEQVGFDTYPSQGNFVLAHVGPEALEIVQELAARGILISWMGKEYSPELNEFIRVSVGSRENNNNFVSSLREILQARKYQGSSKSKSVQCRNFFTLITLSQ